MRITKTILTVFAGGALFTSGCAGGGGGGASVTPPPTTQPPPITPYASNCSLTPGALSCGTGTQSTGGPSYGVNANGGVSSGYFEAIFVNLGATVSPGDDVYSIQTGGISTNQLIYRRFQSTTDALGRVRSASNVAYDIVGNEVAGDGSTMSLYDVTNVVNGGLDYVQLGRTTPGGWVGRTTYFATGRRVGGWAIPSTGTAVFTGGTRGSYTTASGTEYQTAGNLTLTADFAASRVTGLASGFKFMDGAGALVSAPAALDFNYTGVITGAEFSGAASGGAMSGQVAGEFYGEPSGPPAEAGLVYRLTGSDGSSMIGAGGVRKQ